MESSHDHLAGPLFERVPAAARRALTHALRGICPDLTAGSRAFFGAPSWKVRLGWGAPLTPWHARFVLGDIIGCPDFGRDEKLAWEFALTFEGVPMTLAFEKFGLRAYVDKQVDEATAEQLADRMAATISRALPLLQKTVLSDVADEQVARGEVNVENHYRNLEMQYQHFKRLSGASLVAAGKAEPIRETHPGPPPSISVRLPEFELRQEARFESNAAVQAFFSMLEHLLLIAFLLSGEDATHGRLATFIGAGWNDKFKRIVHLVDDPDSKRYHDRLVAVHDELRNPAAHGEVHSDGTDFSFILPGVGPVPARLVMRQDRQRTYRWHVGGADDILAELTEVEHWLRTGPLASAVLYGDSGLPLFFGGDIRAELAAARDDPDTLAEMIDRLEWLVDRNANMDW